MTANTKKRQSLIKAIACLLLTLAPTSGRALTLGMTVHEPWVRAMPPAASMSAGYFTLANLTDRADELLRVTSPAAATVSIHFTRQQNNAAIMEKKSKVSIAREQKITFSPGGWHLMLENLKKTLAKGDQVELTLYFKHAKPVTINAVVR